MDTIFKTAIEASVEAGKEILKVYEQPEIEVQTKDDASPLTLADEASNNCINGFLENTGVPIISEENRQIEYKDRSGWETCWIVDPLDGTKEFIKRNGEFTVNIALCTEGRPVFGVIYVPVSRELYYGDVANGRSFKITLNEDHVLPENIQNEDDRIYPTAPGNEFIKVVGSRSHMNQDTQDFIEEAKETYKDVEIVSKGSSLKFCMVAEGIAHIYPRFAPTMEWDTAAGQAICEAVGLRVISKETNKELRYNKENLLNPYFVVRQE